MLNWALRYQPVVDFVRSAGGGPLLEVGSGAQGLARYLQETVFAVDVDFVAPRHRLLVPARGSITALPFRDDTFSVVVSCDTLEHVPPPMRPPGVLEMLRVSRRHVVLAFPSGPPAENADRRTARSFERLGITPPEWLIEHLAHPCPTAEEVAEWAGQAAKVTRVEGNSSITMHQMVVLGEHLPIVSHVLRRLDHISLVRRLRSVLNAGTTYRDVIFMEKSSSS